MRRALFVTATAVALSAALPATAQDAQAGGLRYLSWSGRPAPVALATTQPGVPAGPAWRVAEGQLRRPAQIIPHGGYASAASLQRGELLPASEPANAGPASTDAWVAPDSLAMAPASRAPAYRPQPVVGQRRPASGSAAYYADNYARPPVETASPVYAGDAPAGLPTYAPSASPQPRAQPAQADAASSAPGPVYAQPNYDAAPSAYGAGPAYVPAGATPAPAAEPVDPMAPRRDALIFSVGRGRSAPPSAAASTETAPSPHSPDATAQPYPTASTDQPAPQRARYYSVHRQNGREPDPTAMPESGYIDGLAVNLPDSLASEDLARPPEPPAMIRDRNGNVRVAPAQSDGDHQ